MSEIPQSLKEVKAYVVVHAGVPGSNMSIRAARSSRGFHAGRKEIFGPDGKGKKDYSVRDARNLKGLTEASSAIDIKLAQKQLRALTAHLVANPGTLLFEVIGPDAKGEATYYSVKTGWKPNHKLAPKSHEWHVHIGYWRDTEFEDRVVPFRSFYEPVGQPAPAPEPEPDPDQDPAPNISDIEQLMEQNELLQLKIAAAQEVLA